jgi:hypothetical protein
MIDGVDIIYVTYELTWLGVLIGVLMVFGFLILSIEAVAYLKECRGDIALALVIGCAVLVVAFNPITDRFLYEKYTVKVNNSVTIAELTKDYEILEQNKDGTLVLKEKRSDGKP